MKNILGIIIAAITLSSCEKVIEVDLNSTAPQIVIVGNITDQNEPATVKITQTVNFSETNSFPAVQGAEVSLEDNAGNKEILKETEAGLYKSSKLKGVAGRTYTLTIKALGQTYTAKSTMPLPVEFEKLSAVESTFGGNPLGGGSETRKRFVVTPVYRDPAGIKNFYRFNQFVNGKPNTEFLISNDNLNDGKINSRPLISRNFDILEGDEVKIELQNIDSAVYDYFYSLNQSAGTGPGGGTTPANPTSNISGGALGYFSAHSVQKASIIVK